MMRLGGRLGWLGAGYGAVVMLDGHSSVGDGASYGSAVFAYA